MIFLLYKYILINIRKWREQRMPIYVFRIAYDHIKQSLRLYHLRLYSNHRLNAFTLKFNYPCWQFYYESSEFSNEATESYDEENSMLLSWAQL